MTLLWCSFLLLLFYALLMQYYRIAWKRLEIFHPREAAPLHFLSVIVPARNEGRHIDHLLDSLRAQEYPAGFFEVLIVDDFSTDDTAARVRRCAMPNVHLLQPEGSAAGSSKKKAIATAVEKASGALLITTDADCSLPPRWLSAYNSFFHERKPSFIAAPVAFTHNGSWLQRFQALDFLALQGITAASVSAQFHTMCNGANLAYTREAFRDVNGFEGIDHVATGDDMLLMHKIWKQDPSRVHYMKSPEAIVSTDPMPTWSAFLSQRKRWASKTLVYEDYRIIAVLALVLAVNVIFPVLLLAAIWNLNCLLYAAAYALLKGGIEWYFVSSVAAFYGRRELLPGLILFQPLHLLYTVYTGISSQLGGYEWKGRKTK